MRYASINPANNRLLKSFPFASHSQILDTINRSSAAFRKYKETSLQSRIEMVSKFSVSMESKKDQLAELVSLEMGRPMS